MRAKWLVGGAIATTAACAGTSTPPPSAPVTSVAAPAPAPPPGALADAATWAKWEHADYLVLTPHRFVSALAPLVRFRESQGHVVAVLEVEPIFARTADKNPDAEALKRAVAEVDAHAKNGLKFLLLAGDAAHPSEDPPDDAVPLPTFYLTKLGYEHHTAKEHDNPIRIPKDEESSYPSDDPYSRIAGAPRIAVGRVPAHDASEMAAFVKKAIDYESAAAGGGDAEWRRRITLFAGAANFGREVDSMLESLTNEMLDDQLSYDYDLRFTFAKYGSPYAYRFDQMETKFVNDLDDGAVLAAYVGHGAVSRFAPADFRGFEFEVGTADDAARMKIPAGKPLFFSIACDTGAFDRPQGEASIAEKMVLNPEGPIAAFASSRESHPYPNALYGLSIIQRFINTHPATVGEGIVAIKNGMREASIGIAELLIDADVDALKKEHEGLYNLFGDPATRLRYADAATVKVGGGAVAPGATFSVDVEAKGVASGLAVVTLETARSALRASIPTQAELDRMPPQAALTTMAEDNRLANDKVVARVEQPIEGGHARATLSAPGAAGDYVVKVLASDGSGAAAAGHAELHVGSAAAR